MKRSFTILYVDDDVDDLAIISEAFEQYTDHIMVIHAGNGIEGIEVLDRMYEKESLPCLLIVDINMPVMDGRQMLKKLREDSRYKDLPVIMFSTSASDQDSQFAETYNAEFITKPSGYSELKSLVDQFVTRCRFETRETA